jgi:F0F1-type ATP synthase assembly protein I
MEKDREMPWWKPGLTIFIKVSASIAVPIIIALYVGKFLDAKYHTAPWIFLGLTLLAFLTSIYSIWKNIKIYIRSLEKEALRQAQDKKEKDENQKIIQK